MMRLASMFVVFALTTSPIYLFPSGLPQISDVFFVLFFIVIFVHAQRKHNLFPVALLPTPWILLVFWVSLVNVSAALYYQSLDFIINPFFWVYNLLVSAGVFYIFKFEPGYKKYVFFGLCSSLIVSALGVILFISEPGRPTGFFNNPNQLAYHSLLMLSALFLLNNFKISGNPYFLVSVLCGLVGIFSAASLAAMAGLVFILLSFMLVNFGAKKIVGTGVILLVAFSILQFSQVGLVGEIADNVQARFSRAETKLVDLKEERNYDRLLIFPQYLFVGAGEGELDRFLPYSKNEIHSSFANMLFSYGIVGFLLFMILLFVSIRSAPLYLYSLYMAPLVYSISHMGLRSTSFWIFIVLVYFTCKVNSQRRLEQ